MAPGSLQLLRPLTAALLLSLFLFLSAPAGADQGGEIDQPERTQLLLEVETGKNRVYLGEPLSLTVTLLADRVRIRDIEFPRFSTTAVTLKPFTLPRKTSVVRDGRDWVAYLFTTTLTANRPGTVELGPAQLRCELLVPEGGAAAFYGATVSRRVTLRSAPLPLTVLTPPVQGRPAGFSGAVGRFTVARTASPTAVHAGDPVTVRTVLRGTGNTAAFSCGSVTGPGLKSYPPRRKLSGTTLACEQVVVPEKPGAAEIPAARVHFFDPEQERYGSATSGAITLQVTASPPSAAAVPAVPPAAAAVPAVPPAATAPDSHRSLGLVAAWMLGGVGAGCVLRWLSRSRASGRGPGPAAPPELGLQLTAAEAALAEEDAQGFYTALFRVLQLCIGHRLKLPAAGITSPLPEESCHITDLQDLHQILTQCDRVRYGKHRAVAAEMADDLLKLRQIVRATSGRR